MHFHLKGPLGSDRNNWTKHVTIATKEATPITRVCHGMIYQQGNSTRKATHHTKWVEKLAAQRPIGDTC